MVRSELREDPETLWRDAVDEVPKDARIQT